MLGKAITAPAFEIIQIGPIEFKVVRVKDLTNEEGEPLYGQVDHAGFKIEIDERLRGNPLLVTLWHEVLHTFEGIYGLELNEQMITTLAPLIVSAMQDNEALRYG